MKPTRKARLLLAGGLACAVVALAIVLPLVLTSGTGEGPVSTLSDHGQPVIESEGHVVRPGQQGYATAYLLSSARDRVTLLSASLVPVRGRPAGKLTHASVYLNHSYDVGGATSSWPPSGDRVRPLHGAVIGHGQAGILFGFTGPSAGHGYTMAAGVRITYRWHGHLYTITAWSAGVACGGQLSSNRCTKLVDEAQDRAVDQAP